MSTNTDTEARAIQDRLLLLRAWGAIQNALNSGDIQGLRDVARDLERVLGITAEFEPPVDTAGEPRTVTIRQNDDGSVDTPKYDLMDELLNGSVVHFEETVASMGEFLTQALEKLDVKAKIEWIMLDSEWSVGSTIGYFKVNKI